jgi:hypothetical protein
MFNANLSRYFDSVSHNELLKLMARRIADGSVLRLIKLSLKGPIEERDAGGTRRMTANQLLHKGFPLPRGVRQVIAALLETGSTLTDNRLRFRRDGAGDCGRGAR